jgi:hypothetical protein
MNGASRSNRAQNRVAVLAFQLGVPDLSAQRVHLRHDGVKCRLRIAKVSFC